MAGGHPVPRARRAPDDVKRSLVRLCIERGYNLFGRDKPGDGMLWLARALANLPANFPGIEHVIRASLSGWMARRNWSSDVRAWSERQHGVIDPPRTRLATVSDEKTRGSGTWPGPVLLRSDPTRDRYQGDRIHSGRRINCDGERTGMVRRWDGMTGAAVGGRSATTPRVTAVHSAPMARKSPRRGAGSACLWEAVSGRPIGGTTEFLAGVTAITFHPDGSRLAAAGDDGRVWFVETATGTLLDDALPHGERVSGRFSAPTGDGF